MNNSSNNHSLPTLAIVLIFLVVFSVVLQKQYYTTETDTFVNWNEGWREVAPFQIPRRAPSAVIVGKYIYVLGGVDHAGNYVRIVEYSPINSDGNLGGWTKTSAMIEGRFYLGAASDGQYLYALGGGGGPIGDDNIPLASVERAIIQPDGSLGEWLHHSYLTTPRRGLKVEVINNYIYAIGGYNGQFLRSTERLDLTSTHQWILEEKESQIDRYIHSTAKLGKRIYLLGGHVEKAGPMSYGDVESTSVSKDGSLGTWEILPSRLAHARFIATAFSLDNYLYIAGGHDGIRRLDSVEMTLINANGKAGNWYQLNPMNFKRSAATSAVIGNRVYILGGMDDSGILNTVETAILGPAGRLGYLVNKQ